MTRALAPESKQQLSRIKSILASLEFFKKFSDITPDLIFFDKKTVYSMNPQKRVDYFKVGDVVEDDIVFCGKFINENLNKGFEEIDLLSDDLSTFHLNMLSIVAKNGYVVAHLGSGYNYYPDPRDCDSDVGLLKNSKTVLALIDSLRPEIKVSQTSPAFKVSFEKGKEGRADTLIKATTLAYVLSKLPSKIEVPKYLHLCSAKFEIVGEKLIPTDLYKQ